MLAVHVASGSFPKRIAALVPPEAVPGTISGPVRQLTALAGALQGVGIECLVVALHRNLGAPSAFASHLKEAGVPHCVVPDRGPFDWRLASTVGAVLRGWRPSLVQTHGYKATAVAYVLRQLGAPWHWIGCFHGSTSEPFRARFYHWLDRRLLGSAERVVVMSHAQARAFRHCGPRVRVIYNAALALPSATHSLRLPIADTLARPIIGVVGRLSREKGVDFFLEACAILAARGLAFSALVAGEGPGRARLEAQCARLRLASRVRFLGHVHDVQALYRTIDLLVLPSRSEGLPNTLLEAMHADVPVVATTVGAVPEVVGTSSAARLVAPGSVAALADAMEQAVTHGDLPEAAAARREVLSRFSLEHRVDAHLQLYRDLLEAAKGRPVCVESPVR
ncbi:MAG TPA: glycosyltransferase [Gemmatimonadales bacterium]|nr:glycosyltransferase [Gemmatimonadales bacterium]